MVAGRCLKDCRFTLPRFLHKSIKGVRLRKQSESKLIRRMDHKKFGFMTYYTVTLSKAYFKLQ